MLLTTTSLISYLAAATLQCRRTVSSTPTTTRRWPILLLGALAILTHGYLLYLWIDGTTHGQNLILFNVFSLSVWLGAILLLLFTFLRSLANLTILLFPLAALSILLAALFPSEHVLVTSQNPNELIHILLALLTFTILSLAALQAMVIAITDHVLRSRYATSMSGFPPLETMERLLFQIVWLGFILLTFVIITSIAFFSNQFFASVLDKSLLTILAWLTFALLLGGRHCLGWRGHIAIRWTLAGVLLLLLSYFGTRIALMF